MIQYDIFSDAFCIINQDKKMKIARNMSNLSFLHGVMQYAKGAPHLLNPFADFFCVPKRNRRKKRAPLRGACRANSSHRLCRMLRTRVTRRFYFDLLSNIEAPRWRFSYRLSVRLRRTFLKAFSIIHFLLWCSSK